MKNTNKKGFTIVELVIVIAVIAILAAVLIPTFVGLVNKANVAADQQAVNQMNKALAMNDALEGTDNILDVFAALEEVGMTAKNYKPLAKDMYFFYDAGLKKVLYVDKDMKVVAPEEHKDLTNTGRTWLSLTQTIATKTPANYTVTDKTVDVKVTSGAEMLYVIKEVKKGNVTDATITIPSDGIDMMGASFNIAELKSKITIKGEGTTAVISNATAVETGKYGDGETKGENNQYNTALFGKISGGELTIENVTFENVHVKNTHASNVAILVSNMAGGKLTLNNVTIKNSSVVGHANVGALVGLVSEGHGNGTISVTGKVDLKNVDVATVGGRSGLIIGCVHEVDVANLKNALNTAAITVDENCSYTLYECDQNKGTSPSGKPLGLQEDGQVLSWCYDGVNEEDYNTNKYFIEKALVTVIQDTAPINVKGNEIFIGSIGWN